MRVVAALALATMLLMCSSAVDALAPKGDVLSLDYTFEKYVKDYRKPYVCGTGEYARREAQFKASLARVLQWNSHPDKKYTKGINHMSDWTAPEYKAIRGTRHTPTHKSPFAKKWKGEGGMAPPSVDWRKSNPAVLTAVKDQGNCGDCWAHAVTEAVESAYARATGDLYVLSQQQVTSCTPGVGECFGCGGFFPQYAYDFIAQAGQNASMGLVEEWFYSFSSWEGDSGTCFTNMTKPLDNGIVAAVSITGFNQVQNNSQEAVMEAVATLGPLSILVDATSWQEYESGVFTGCSPYGQGDFELDHAVMLVGYGHDTVSGYDYWIVRNSWSAAWGENGYIRIQKDTAAPQCGHTYSIDCVNQTHTWPACGPCGVLTDAQYPIVNATRRQL